MGDRLISQEDWYSLYDIDRFIYSSPLDTSFQVLLQKIKKIIPFTKSLTYLTKYSNGIAESFNFKSYDMPDSHLKLYKEKYANDDFVNWFVNSDHDVSPRVFRESDLVNKEYRVNSCIMKEWMEPMGLYYGLGSIIATHNIRYGGIFLYRGETDNDFSKKELAIAEILNFYIGRKFSSDYPDGLESQLNNQLDIILLDRNLTKREKEIIAQISKGTFRNQLTSKMFITENTLNKHFDNIYKKLKINTYEELLQMIKRQKGNNQSM